MTATPPQVILDTNAYALFFQNPKSPQFAKLESTLKTATGIDFFIPEIVSMEIHSVLGKYRRGGAALQHTPCDRHVVHVSGPIACTHTCVFPERRRISSKAFGKLQKMIRDIEACRGDLRATVLPIGTDEFLEARTLLATYADQFSFGSHDALVAATALVSARRGKLLSLVTSDKALKAVCTRISVPVIDPIKLV